MSILSTPARRGQCQTVHEVIEMYLAQAQRDLAAFVRDRRVHSSPLRQVRR